MILELQFVIDTRTFFGHCHVTLPYKEILSIFGHCHVTFPCMELFLFSLGSCKKVKVFCFSDSFVQKKTQQSDGSCIVTSDSQPRYKVFKKQSLYFCKHI